jgi:hypothetical protein
VSGAGAIAIAEALDHTVLVSLQSIPSASAVHESATVKRPGRGRKLHLGHFAFMRAVVQGLDTRHSWERYLRTEGDHDDIRNVRRTVAWIRDEFAAAAKRSDRFGTARLVKIDVQQLLDDARFCPRWTISPRSAGWATFPSRRSWKPTRQNMAPASSASRAAA